MGDDQSIDGWYVALFAVMLCVGAALVACLVRRRFRADGEGVVRFLDN